MRFSNVVLALALAVGPLTGCARTSNAPSAPDPLDATIVAAMKAAHIPGMSVAVVQNGKIVKLAGYGLADIGQQRPASDDTMYQTGSIGKQFTSMAVMMLVQAGKIRLDDPITKYLGNLNPQWHDVTVRNLLTHTSGITNASIDDIDMSQDSDEGELLQTIASAPLAYAPGAKFKYSNAGYVLLGFIIGKVTGGFYGDYLKHNVWEPLGMSSTQIIDENANLPRLAHGYYWDKKWKDQEYVAPFWNTTADGSMYSTAEDLARWAIALDAGRFLTPASYRQMYAPVRLRNGKTHDYGFGWYIESNEHGRIYDHDGTWQGYTAYITRHIDAHVDVVVMTNLGGSDDVDEIGESIAKYYMKKRSR